MLKALRGLENTQRGDDTPPLPSLRISAGVKDSMEERRRRVQTDGAIWYRMDDDEVEYRSRSRSAESRVSHSVT